MLDDRAVICAVGGSVRGTRQTLLSVWCREGSKGELAAQEAGGRVELQLQHVDLLAQISYFQIRKK